MTKKQVVSEDDNDSAFAARAKKKEFLSADKPLVAGDIAKQIEKLVIGGNNYL